MDVYAVLKTTDENGVTYEFTGPHFDGLKNARKFMNNFTQSLDPHCFRGDFVAFGDVEKIGYFSFTLVS